jgi:hypothetical protein
MFGNTQMMGHDDAPRRIRRPDAEQPRAAREPADDDPTAGQGSTLLNPLDQSDALAQHNQTDLEFLMEPESADNDAFFNVDDGVGSPEIS